MKILLKLPPSWKILIQGHFTVQHSQCWVESGVLLKDTVWAVIKFRIYVDLIESTWTFKMSSYIWVWVETCPLSFVLGGADDNLIEGGEMKFVCKPGARNITVIFQPLLR